MRKIGEIKGVPVVEGNVNEVTKNQIHYKEEEGGIQLSKRNNENKLNSITGSSEGGGDTLYYYKWKDNADKFNEIFDIIGQMGRVKNIINGGRLFYNLIYTYDNQDFNNKELMRNSDAFCIFGEQTPIVAGNNNNYMIIPKGNLIDKINALNVLYPSEDASQIIPLVIDYVNNSFSEITKEEYESLITYTPEL